MHFAIDRRLLARSNRPGKGSSCAWLVFSNAATPSSFGPPFLISIRSEETPDRPRLSRFGIAFKARPAINNDGNMTNLTLRSAAWGAALSICGTSSLARDLVGSNWDGYMAPDATDAFNGATGITDELGLHATNEGIMGKLIASGAKATTLCSSLLLLRRCLTILVWPKRLILQRSRTWPTSTRTRWRFRIIRATPWQSLTLGGQQRVGSSRGMIVSQPFELPRAKNGSSESIVTDAAGGMNDR